MKTKLIVTALVALLGMLIGTAVAQVNVAFNIADSQTRLNGTIYTIAFAVFVLIPIAIVQCFRKPRLLVYGRLAAAGVCLGAFFQYAGIVGVEEGLVSVPTAMLLVLFGIGMCVASVLFQFFAPRILRVL